MFFTHTITHNTRSRYEFVADGKMATRRAPQHNSLHPNIPMAPATSGKATDRRGGGGEAAVAVKEAQGGGKGKQVSFERGEDINL